MFIHRKTNKGGSISIQVIDTSGKRDKLIRTIGSSRNMQRIEELRLEAQTFIDQYRHQQTFNFGSTEEKSFFQAMKAAFNLDSIN